MSKFKPIALIIPIILVVLQITSCKKDKETKNNDPVIHAGWTGGDNPSQVPTSLNYTFAGATTTSSVDLTPYLPPIGDQNPTGTCVAWACGYYAKSANEAIIYHKTTSQLQSPSNQFSPKYLFYSIPDNLKGGDCNGTDFVHALDILQQKGCATMATVPFINLGSCSNSGVQPAWNTEASQHKIKYYRKIEFSLARVKQELTNKNPVIIGVRVGQNLYNYHGGILSSSGALYNSYHAMTVVGYDDARNAFRVVNSWGTSWGEGGYVWVDYNFFFGGNFVYNQNLYIIASEEGAPNPNPPAPNSGVDLASWVYSDVSTSQQTGQLNSRLINFNLFNIGTQPATSASNWSFFYLYYNAYDANDYGILFQDGFNTTVSPGTYFCPTGYNCNFNYAIQPGSSFSQTVFNLPSITRGYFVPPLTGFYYLILVADPGGAFAEQNRQNNIFYTTGQFPKYFQFGYSNRSNNSDSSDFSNKLIPSNANLHENGYNSAVNENNKNAYTPGEILSFLKEKVRSGDFRKKIQGFQMPQPYKY